MLCLERFDPYGARYNLKQALRLRSVGGFRRHISGGEIGAEWSEIPFEPVLPCYLPVKPLFGERPHFLANRLKTIAFLWIFTPRIARNRAKKGANREE